MSLTKCIATTRVQVPSWIDCLFMLVIRFYPVRHMRVFEKRLSPTEKSRHWITVPAADRESFPPSNEPFQVRIGCETVEVHIDSNNRMLGLGWSAFDKLDLDNPSAHAVVEKTSTEGYILKKK